MKKFASNFPGKISTIGFFILLSVACANKQQADLVIDNAAILDIETGEYLKNRVLVVNNDEIVAIEPALEKTKFKSSQIIDASGQYIIPALGDMHVHLQSESELANYVRYGVGAVFNLSGTADHLQMRNKVERSDLIGPRIFSAGPTLDGEDPTNPLFVRANEGNAQDIISWIRRQGFDGVKVYQQMDKATLNAVVSAANDNDLMTIGHVSRIAGIDGALEAGLKNIAHGEELSFPYFLEATGSYDETKVTALAAQLKTADVTVTPMINYLENIPAQATALDAYLARGEVKLVPAAMKQSWDSAQGYYSNRDDPEKFVAQISNLAGFVATLTNAMNEEGVPLILGTDAGFGGAIPGYSVHQELESLVAAGLSPLEALQTATLNIGVFLKRADLMDQDWGVIKPGVRADFLLLSDNPLNNISATQELNAAVLSGKVFSADDLASIESNAIARQEKLAPLAAAFEKHLLAGDLAALKTLTQEYLNAGGKEPLMAPDNCIFLGYRFYYGGKRELAGEVYEVCSTMASSHSPLFIHIARAKEASGDVEGALRAYETAMSINPWYGAPQKAIERLKAGE